MNITFNMGGIKVKLPEVSVDVEVEDISYALTDASPLEIAQASAQMTKSIIELVRELQEVHEQTMDLGLPKNPVTTLNGFKQGQQVNVPGGDEAIILSFDEKEDTALLRFDNGNNDYYTAVYYVEDLSA